MAKALREKGIALSMFVDEGEHNGKWVQPALEDAIIRADRNFERNMCFAPCFLIIFA